MMVSVWEFVKRHWSVLWPMFIAPIAVFHAGEFVNTLVVLVQLSAVLYLGICMAGVVLGAVCGIMETYRPGNHYGCFVRMNMVKIIPSITLAYDMTRWALEDSNAD